MLCAGKKIGSRYDRSTGQNIQENFLRAASHPLSLRNADEKNEMISDVSTAL
jgi:hypothetical protein